MRSDDSRHLAKLAAIALSVIWIGWAGWDQFADLPESEVLNHNSEAVREKMKECEGSYRNRYDCKEAIIVKSGQQTFSNMMERLAIVVLPPIGIAIAFSVLFRRRHHG